MWGLTDSNQAIALRGISTTDVTTKDADSGAIVNVEAYKISGTSWGLPGSNANIVRFGNGGTTKFIFDTEGDSHQDVGTAWTNFDDEPDALICRSAGIVMDQSSIVKSKFDDWGRDHKEDLIRTGLIPRMTAKQEADGVHPLMNTTQLARLHNGAIWQTHVEVQELKEELDAKDNRILALEAQVNNINRRLN